MLTISKSLSSGQAQSCHRLEFTLETQHYYKQAMPYGASGKVNRDLGTITSMQSGQVSVRMNGKEGRSMTFDPREFRQFDHGYAVTSHRSQGLEQLHRSCREVLSSKEADSLRGMTARKAKSPIHQ